MAKILCQNGQYTGISASVEFVDGVGETDNPYLIEWFKENGYIVEETVPADIETADPEKKSLRKGK